jgi:hypothetical protein
MPVVLVEVGGVARSGHEYGDRTGVEYEYPAGRYERLIQTGDRFVYQKPRVGYIGCGIIGAIRRSAISGRLKCDVLAVEMFPYPVGLRDDFGAYWEADQAFWRDKVYWGQGVRPLSEQRLEGIVATAGALAREMTGRPMSPYADPVAARALEDYSVQVAVAAMIERFREPVVAMPRNNPGFDLRVGNPRDPTRFIEVKASRSPDPLFFMSDGERRFSLSNASRYTLVVVSGIDLAERRHGGLLQHDGAVDGPSFELSAHQWRGRVLPGSSSTA